MAVVQLNSIYIVIIMYNICYWVNKIYYERIRKGEIADRTIKGKREINSLIVDEEIN